MAETPIQVVENNDTKLLFSVVIGGTTTPFDLTGASVEFFIKPSRTTADNAVGVVKYDSVGGSPEITVTDATAGELEVQTAAADLAAAGRKWYRLDAVISGRRETLLYGPLTVVDA